MSILLAAYDMYKCEHISGLHKHQVENVISLLIWPQAIKLISVIFQNVEQFLYFDIISLICFPFEIQKCNRLIFCSHSVCDADNQQHNAEEKPCWLMFPVVNAKEFIE